MRKLVLFLKRYWLVLLWLSFGPIVAEAGRNPGFVQHPESVPYPVRPVILTWVRLGFEAGIFFLILRSGGRLPIAFALAMILLLLSFGSTVTDMPGYYNVPGLFHLALAAILGAVWAARVARRPIEE